MKQSSKKYSTVNCSVSEGAVSGWSTVVLANELLRVIVILGKCADIYQLVHLQTDIIFTVKTPYLFGQKYLIRGLVAGAVRG